MNNLIREIAQQAGFSSFESLDERIENIAELIIKECISLTENCTNSWTQDTGAERISKHFGIE